MTACDIIFLGSSPNALTAAAYLARSGQRVLVLEQSEHVGGASSTTEFADGFRGDIGLTNGRLSASVVKELSLHQHGLEIIERETMSSLLSDGRSFTIPADRKAAADRIRSFATENDANQYAKFLQLLDLASDLLRAAFAKAPPRAHHPSPSDSKELSLLAGKLADYGKREMTEVMRLLVMPVRDLLDEWFESEALKGLLAGPAVRALTQGPFAGGTTFNLLHHLAIGDGYFRATARGGVGAVSQALAAAARSHGAEIRTKTAAPHVVIADGVATGVKLDDGEQIDTPHVVSDYDARYTFTKMVAPFELEPEFNRAVKHVRYNGSAARINLALRELPEFAGLKHDALRGTLTVAPSVSYIERAFDAAKIGDLSDHPYIEINVPSLADNSLAPDGQHVMSLWIQYAPYNCKIEPQRILEVTLKKLSEFAPQLRSLVLHSQVLTAHDYESRFNLAEGHLYGGDMTLAQSFYLRPIPGFAQYRTPIEGLYLSGFATHPGGGLSGLAGANLASELTRNMALSV